MTGPRLDFRLLGPLEVVKDGRLVDTSRSRHWEVLALLLVHRNQTVPAGRIIRSLWGDAPPATAINVVHRYIRILRSTLGDPHDTGAGGGLGHRPSGGGYQLTVTAGQVDIDRFCALAERGRGERAGRRLELAWERYTEALAQWRGPLLEGLPRREFTHAESARLEELRLAAVTERLQVGLELGRHGELVAELESHVRAHPTREELRWLLMLALYRSGRQTDALGAYRDVRKVFLDEFGLEPGARLQALERAILNQDSSLERGADQAASWPGPTPGIPVNVAALLPTAPGAASQPSAAPPEAVRVPREERKRVTVLALRFTAPTPADPEDAQAQADAVTQQVAARIRRYGGIVLSAASLTIAGVMAVFGGDRVREDDPERAVRAALELVAADALARAGAVAGAGVATGEVVVTSADPMPAAAVAQLAGGAVDTAISLQASAAPGTVLVAADTYRATMHAIAYRPQPAAGLQPGGAGVWQALAPRGRTGAEAGGRTLSPLTERDTELALLDDVLGRCLRARTPQLLTIVSAPGLGKTRLVGELSRIADGAEVLVTWRVGRSDPNQQGACSALAELVKAHAGVLEDDPAELAADKLRKTVAAVADADEADWVAQQLQALLGADPAPTGDRRAERFAGWARFFQATAAQRPTVVVFEDLQWADAALLDFVEGLAEQVGDVPLLVVATGRLELLDRRPGWGGGQRNATQQSLPPLSRDGTRTLLAALLGDLPLPDGAVEDILGHAGGNPLYVEEYARMLGELPPAAVHAGRLPVPATIQQLIAARIDTLPPEVKRLLHDAAVVGETCWAGALAAVGQRDPGEVAEGLGRLERGQFLRRVRVASIAGETEYTFRHALVRDVAYGQLLRGDRAATHRRVAGWIESLNPERTDDRVEQLAHHYTQALELSRLAGQPDDALTRRTREVLHEAGNRALWLGAVTTAERHYTTALELWPEPDLGHAELLYGLGQSRAYGAHDDTTLLAARDAFDALGASKRALDVEVALANLAQMRGEGATAERYLDAALARDTAPTAGKAHALATKALDLMIRDDHDDCLRLTREALAMADTLKLSRAARIRVEAQAFSARGGSRLKHGDPDGAADSRRALELMHQLRHPLAWLVRFDLAFGYWCAGDLQMCAAEVAEHQRQATPQIRHWYDGVAACLDYAAGHWDAALTHVDWALRREATGYDAYLDPYYHWLRGRIRLARGDVDGARADAEAGYRLGEHARDPRFRQSNLALLGLAEVAAGRRAAAAELLEGLLGELHDRPVSSCATPDLGALIVTLDGPTSLPDGLSPTRWHEAVRAFVRRDFEAAAKAFAAIGSPADEALVAVHAPTKAGRAGLEHAAGFYRDAGGSAHLSQIQALLAALDPSATPHP